MMPLLRHTHASTPLPQFRGSIPILLRARLSRGLGHISSASCADRRLAVTRSEHVAARAPCHCCGMRWCKSQAAPLLRGAPLSVARCNPILLAMGCRSRQ